MAAVISVTDMSQEKPVTEMLEVEGQFPTERSTSILKTGKGRMAGSNNRFQVDTVKFQDGDNEKSEMDNLHLSPNMNAESQMTYLHSLRRMTREAFPELRYYRDPMSLHAEDRPGVHAFMEEETIQRDGDRRDSEDAPDKKKGVIKFGWKEGVLMRCLLNIWGVILFLRLSWVIGQAGIGLGLLVIVLANCVTFITALSMSAVATNGQIKGGGIYYMISRSLGPEFGGAIGLMFTIANTLAVALYIVGFCESLRDLLKYYFDGAKIIDGDLNDIRVVGTGTLILILLLAYVGMDWVTRFQMILLFVLIASQIDFVVGSFMGPMDVEEKARGFAGYDPDIFDENFGPDYRKQDGEEQSFFSVFGVFFPAVTGIVAGANLSGDLKDPVSAIPKGTLLAIGLTFLTYIGYAVMLGGCVWRDANGDVNIFQQGNISMSDNFNFTWDPENYTYGPEDYKNCSLVGNGNDPCEFGLANSPQVMELVSAWGPLIYAGCFAATLSSAIASLVGAPRVFQALCRDKIYPYISVFGKGTGPNDDPIRGYFLVFVLSLAMVLVANLNLIAPIQSNFFLAAYALINYSCFHASITKSPGWRPGFKYYNTWVSLLGALLCVAVMFLMDWIFGLVTVVVIFALYMYVSYRNLDINWGASTQAQTYNSALSSVQNLNRTEEHVKNFRPSMLILSGPPNARPPLVDFGNLITKNLSLMMCGNIVKDSLNPRYRRAMVKQADMWLNRHKIKSFYTMTESQHFDVGVSSMLQLAGLGRLRPNTVLMGFKNNWNTCPGHELSEYYGAIRSVFEFEMGVTIMRVKEGLDYSKVIAEDVPATVEKKDETGMKKNLSSDQLSQDGIEMEATNHVGQEGEKTSVSVKKKRKTSLTDIYTGVDGPLDADTIAALTQFRVKKAGGTIDVWWLYDDGGLTLLIPFLLNQRSQFSGCKLRIFSLANSQQELGSQQRNMATLLTKFRIDYTEVTMIEHIMKKPTPESDSHFDEMIQPFKDGEYSDEELTIASDQMKTMREKNRRHIRIGEEVRKLSKDAALVVMTVPLPTKSVPAPLYMAWLDTMTRDLPPVLMVRGNQKSVLTYRS